MTLKDYYINRNVKILELFHELRDSTSDTVRNIVPKVATEIKVSPSLVKAVLYDKKYAFAHEAWKIFNNSKAN